MAVKTFHEKKNKYYSSVFITFSSSSEADSDFSSSDILFSLLFFNSRYCVSKNSEKQQVSFVFRPN